MKKIITALFSLLFSGCMALSGFFVSSVCAETSDKQSLEEATEAAAQYAEQIYSEIDPENLRLTGPYSVYPATKIPETESEAYAKKGLTMYYDEEDLENYKLYFVYDEEEPLTYLVLQKSGDWLLQQGGSDLNVLLEKKAEMEAELPGKEIGYFLSYGQIRLFTPELSNGYILAAEGSYDSSDTKLVRTRDYAVYEYEYYQELYRYMEETGTTAAELKQNAKLGGSIWTDLINGKTYPVWKFWLPRIGIPAAVVLIAAGAVVLLVRRKKKAKAE